MRLLRLLELMALDDTAYRSVLGAVARHGEELGVAFVDHYTARPLHAVFGMRDGSKRAIFRIRWCRDYFSRSSRERRDLNVGVRLFGSLARDGVDLTRDFLVVKSDGDQDRPS